MNATEELRRLLDEHGIEHEDSDDNLVYNHTTSWSRGRCKACYSEYRSGVTRMVATCVSPGQAIAATVGRDTCHDVGDERIFHCSACGFGLSDVYLSDEDYLWDDDGEWIEPWPPFCPNCGRRVVEP